MDFEAIGIGRKRAALACGVVDTQLHNWMVRYGLFKDEPTPRPFTFPECLAVAKIKEMIDYGFAPSVVMELANQRAAYRSLLRGRPQLVLQRDLAGRFVDIGDAEPERDQPLIFWPVDTTAYRLWPRFTSHAIDLCRSPSAARETGEALSRANDVIPFLRPEHQDE